MQKEKLLFLAIRCFYFESLISAFIGENLRPYDMN
jgi:hypothetical protein